MSNVKAAQPPPVERANGDTPQPDPLAAALASELTIADEAARIRGEQIGIDRALLLKLWPLLRLPIPQGFIQTLPATKGKPYPSTGIKSVQVQIDRMDNVLTPLGWRYRTEYSEGGKVCEVVVEILDAEGNVLFSRDSSGGVNQASTQGNLLKGSFTNAAKVAFARVGPGHEVYIGATDFDPDVDADAAAAQAVTDTGQPVAEPPLSAEGQQKVLDAFTDAGVTAEDFGLYLKSVGVDKLEALTASRAYQLRELLDSHLAKASEA